MLESFIETLFDEHEHTCLADTPKGTRVAAARSFDPRKHAFFTINPLDPLKDNLPLDTFHRPNRPRRADHNVVAFRNILIEMDKGPLTEQWEFIHKIDLPYTTAVFSGGKSYHFIVSLTKVLKDRESYDQLVRRIYSVLKDRIDPACKNPSRLSRTPGFYREEKDRYQNLCELRSRVEINELEEWLLKNGASLETKPQKTSFFPRPAGQMQASTLKFFADGAEDGMWNNTLFKAACDAFQIGWSIDDFVDKAERITGHLDHSDLLTIRSAWQRAARRVS